MSVAIARRPRGTLDLQLKTDLVQDNLPAKVVDRVYIGSIHAAFNQDGLLARGITHVLNASGLPATFPRSFTYFNVDLRDKEEADILGALGAASVFIEAGTEKGGVLVHCAGGRSRSAAFIAAYLMMKRELCEWAGGGADGAVQSDAPQLQRDAKKLPQR
eukprot:TRINITY_DN4105_c0_g1_i1.p2 TRINITY_DN4105_c0_g1~~TRINITY_DN4105_c0_g1_i1.p2  ORF type:complete len:160 (-),score=35.12 TRINITY_DN4105_c0_g1_i1:786-1265(-)